MDYRENIKRTHIAVGKKATTFSLDESLYHALQARLKENRLSVRQWAQAHVDSMLSETTADQLRQGISLSRRLQSLAIALIANPAQNALPAHQRPPTTPDPQQAAAPQQRPAATPPATDPLARHLAARQRRHCPIKLRHPPSGGGT